MRVGRRRKGRRLVTLPHEQVHVALAIPAECPGGARVGIAVVGAAATPPLARMPRGATGSRGRAARRQAGEIIARVSGTQGTRSVLCRGAVRDGQVVVIEERAQT